jgi:molecular chaperone HtpG
VWNDIRAFVEYACMRDRKFYDRVKDSLLMELTDGTFTTTADYLEKAKEKHENTVYYTSDKAAQAQYISMFASQEIAIAVYDKQLDAQFLSMLESYDSNVKYLRIDADIAGALKNEGDTTANEELEKLFKKVSENEQLKVEFASLKDESVPVLLTISEQSRRMEEMMRMYGMSGMGAYPLDATLTVNLASSLIQKLDGMEDAKKETTASYLYRLALLSQRKLNAEELKAFLRDSYNVLELL